MALDTYTRSCEKCNFELLASVFSHDDDIVLINVGPSPRPLVGWPAVARLYQGLFSASNAVKMEHTNVAVKIFTEGAAACVTCNQMVEWTVQGKTYCHERIRTTFVLEKQKGTWRIVHGHWSLPSTEEPKLRRS